MPMTRQELYNEPKDTLIGIRLSKRMVRRIEEVAKFHGQTKSSFFQNVFRRLLDSGEQVDFKIDAIFRKTGYSDELTEIEKIEAAKARGDWNGN